MNSTVNPITEDDIASFLVNTPDFFERHAELLSTVQLSSGHGSRAVSLQERQASMLREKIRGLETRLVEMIRHGQDNVAIADNLQRWTRSLLAAAHSREVPPTIVSGLTGQFQIPQVALKIWGVKKGLADENFCAGVSDDAKAFADSLGAPYCGVNAGFEAVTWLPDPALALSVALVPLRVQDGASACGLLVLASPDAERFHDGMGTDFLERIGQLASAALVRLNVAEQRPRQPQ